MSASAPAERLVAISSSDERILNVGVPVEYITCHNQTDPKSPNWTDAVPKHAESEHSNYESSRFHCASSSLYHHTCNVPGPAQDEPPLVEKEFGFLIAILHAMFEN